ncbi:protein of Calcipressin family [Pseudohyphozyma bogoriensis]|nr:protein of Calcipressin family [Pseudohyphozyma bogoriensis]
MAARRKIQATNSLILLLPPLLFSARLLPLFEAHFGSYGEVVSWTPLESLGRVLVVYTDVEGATAARKEMDGFCWEEDEDERQTGAPPAEPFPLRAFFGPNLALPLPSLHSTLLSVPALSKNFLISPPGSPPVGWEQTLEEAPNSQTHPTDDWGEELARALRYLSVSSGGDEDEDEDVELKDQDDDLSPSAGPETHTLLSAGPSEVRPSVTLSTPPAPSTPTFEMHTESPPPGATKITAVKATIESMLGRKKSFEELGGGMAPPRRTIIPTARPPTDDEPAYREF